MWKPFLDWVAAAPQDFRSASTAADRRACRRGTGGTPRFCAQDLPGVDHRRRPARRAGEATCSGRATRARRASSCTATSRRGCRRRCCSRTQQTRSPMRSSPRAGIWRVSLHFNKGLAGAPAEAIAAARDTAMNPAVLDAFALAIIAGGGPPAYPGHAGPRARSRDRRAAMPRRSRAPCATAQGSCPSAGSYVSESRFFEPHVARTASGGRTTRGCCAVKKQVRSRRALLRAPRRRQRGLERRRQYPIDRTLESLASADPRFR